LLLNRAAQRVFPGDYGKARIPGDNIRNGARKAAVKNSLFDLRITIAPVEAVIDFIILYGKDVPAL